VSSALAFLPALALGPTAARLSAFGCYPGNERIDPHTRMTPSFP
jgi:hypothetical protein